VRLVARGGAPGQVFRHPPRRVVAPQRRAADRRAAPAPPRSSSTWSASPSVTGPPSRS